jgi:hypothetical protein
MSKWRVEVGTDTRLGNFATHATLLRSTCGTSTEDDEKVIIVAYITKDVDENEH